MFCSQLGRDDSFLSRQKQLCSRVLLMCSQTSYFFNTVAPESQMVPVSLKSRLWVITRMGLGGHCFAGSVVWMGLPRLEAPKILTHGWGGPEGNQGWWMPCCPFPAVWFGTQSCSKWLFRCHNFRDSQANVSQGWAMLCPQATVPWFCVTYFCCLT